MQYESTGQEGELSLNQLKKLKKEAYLPDWAKNTYAVDKLEFSEKVDDSELTFQTFDALGISRELEDAVRTAFPFITRPTKIQMITIPQILKGKNVVCADQTGTGKTLAFVLPLMESLLKQEKRNIKLKKGRVRGLIVIPNRELALQIEKVIKSIIDVDKRFSHWNLYSMSGGLETVKKDVIYLKRGNDILIATPERIYKHLHKGYFKLDQLTHVIFDEADTLMYTDKTNALIDHFISQLRENNYEKNISYAFVSATVSSMFVSYLEKTFPKITSAMGPTVHKTVNNLEQEFLFGSTGNFKDRLLLSNIKKYFGKKILIFCNRQETARGVRSILKKNGYEVLLMTATVPPKIRMKNFDIFNREKSQILVTTDLASRGLDIEVPIDLVILYDFPLNAIDYIHRIGRTARAGKPGKVISFISKKDHALATKIRNAIEEGRSVAEIKPTKPTKTEIYKKRKVRIEYNNQRNSI